MLPGLPPGTYYLFVLIRYNNQMVLWDLKVDLKDGPNAITLNQETAAPVK